MEINDSKLFEKCNRYSTLNISNGCTISDDILNKINIESISQSELNEQYVDYVFARRFVPMGSRLYENNGIVKSTSTVEASDVVRDIKHKYNLQYWQIFVDNRKYNVKFIIVIPDTSINVTLVKHDMELLGYYVGGTKTIYDQNDREWCVLQFEPYYQPSETTRVKGCVRLFHISPIENKDDIKKNGIIAKEKTIDNKNRFYYPKRCFFVNGYANHEDLEEVIQTLYKNENYGNIEGLFCVFHLNTKSIPNDVDFFYDANFANVLSFYSNKSIPENAIYDIEIYDANKNIWLEQKTSIMDKIKSFFGFAIYRK